MPLFSSFSALSIQYWSAGTSPTRPPRSRASIASSVSSGRCLRPRGLAHACRADRSALAAGRSRDGAQAVAETFEADAAGKDSADLIAASEDLTRSSRFSTRTRFCARSSPRMTSSRRARPPWSTRCSRGQGIAGGSRHRRRRRPAALVDHRRLRHRAAAPELARRARRGRARRLHQRRGRTLRSRDSSTAIRSSLRDVRITPTAPITGSGCWTS